MAERGDEIVSEHADRRGSLEPLWIRLQSHDSDIRELYRHTADAHARVNATDAAITFLRDDIKSFKDQTHTDNQQLMAAIQDGAVKQAKAAGVWSIIKWAVPIIVAAASTVLGGFALMHKMGFFNIVQAGP